VRDVDGELVRYLIRYLLGDYFMKQSSWKDLEYVVARIHDTCIPVGEVIWSDESEDVDTGESR